VKHLGWRPPWVKKREGMSEKDTAEYYVGDNHVCQDLVGHGRIPLSWWTKNLAYNKAYEIHRLNTRSEVGKEAVSGQVDTGSSTRFDFARYSPEITVFMSSLRTELDMRMVMPAIVPHTKDEPCLTFARAENSASGHPHHHGFTYGAGNPQVRRMEDDKAAAVDVSSSEQETEEEEEKSDGAARDGEGEALGARLKERRKKVLRLQHSTASSIPEPQNAMLAEDKLKVDSRSDKEEEFWKFFKDLVSEWNPCYDDEGRFRYVWDEEVGAHDVHVVEEDGEEVCAQPLEPERTRLREVLDRVLAAAERGEKLDLEPLRSLVGKLVQSSGRHTDHGKHPPKIGKHACAQGSSKCPTCRYGFPHKMFCRGCDRKTHFEKGEREGSWFLRFPRNDPYCNSYEPHFLLANLGNVDWRPCVNLWAVVEYVTKYATKAPKGSRRLG
jgi:hypothetical protein